MGDLYIWANPVKDAPFLDHTWVTSYPFTNGEYPTFEDIPAGASYWYCWGEYHPEGKGGIHHKPNGAIGQTTADYDKVQELVLANTLPPAFPGKPAQPQDGCIVFYGVDGVCQNLANQLLFASGGPDQEPVRVRDARGYQIASFFFSNYGINEQWNTLKKVAGDVLEPADDFTTFMNEVLGDDVSEIQKLEVEAARAFAQAAMRELHREVLSGKLESTHLLEAALAAIWLGGFAAVDAAVGFDNFLRLFPSLDILPKSHEHALGWVDREMLERSFVAHRAAAD